MVDLKLLENWCPVFRPKLKRPTRYYVGSLRCEKAHRREKPQVERMTGIEPALSAWEAEVLPLNYIRVADYPAPFSVGDCWILPK